MVYVVGIIGFIGGFMIGQMVLYFLLRYKSKEDLLHDKFLKWQFGILNWLIAILGSYSSIQMYNYYFIAP